MQQLQRVLACLAIAGVVILAACGTAPPTEPGEGTEGQTTTDTGADQGTERETVTLTFLKFADELDALALEIIEERFHEIEGGRWSYVNIEYDAKPFEELFTAIETAVATGSDIDIIQVDGPDMKHFAYNGVLMDLTDHFTQEEMAQWAPQSVIEGSIGDRFYGPPFNQSCSVMWYNTDITDAVGLDVPTTLEDAWTYEEALPAWQRTTLDDNGDGVPEVYGVLLNQGWGWGDYEMRLPGRSAGTPGSPTYEGIGPDGITFDGYFNSPESIAAYEWIQTLFTEYEVSATESPWNAFWAGLATFYISPDRVIGVQQDQYSDLNMRAMGPPYFTTPICQTGAFHYAIAATTDHFEEALAFVRFAASDEGAEVLYQFQRQLPANINLLNVLPDYQVYPQSMVKETFFRYGVPRVQTPAYTEYNVLFTEFFGNIVMGADVRSQIEEYTQLMEEAAAKYAGWNE
jgi:fructooligosaccharide transport system substrate-binding protein